MAKTGKATAPVVEGYDEWADRILLEMANAGSSEQHMIIAEALEEAFNDGLFLS